MPIPSIDLIKKRAEVWKLLRKFFEKRKILEVETPILASSSDPNPYLMSFIVYPHENIENDPKAAYLQTSPELYMKQILASGSGDIFQITKAFRADEEGKLHQSEFSLLEWYRVNWSYHQLMDEVQALLKSVGNYQQPFIRLSYQEAFEYYLDFNPHKKNIKIMQEKLIKHVPLHLPSKNALTYDQGLELLFSHCIQPKLQRHFIYDYPASQAMLSQIKKNRPHIAERFELFIQGVELANGFQELTHFEEQKARFQAQNAIRKIKQLRPIPINQSFLSALQKGMPPCSGVALGLDRLILLMTNSNNIQEICIT